MQSKTRVAVALFLGVALLAGNLQGAEPTGLTQGAPDLKSAGALAFGPAGLLFVGDPKGGAIFAIDTGDKPSSPATGDLNVNDINEKVAGLLGTTAKNILLNNMAVNPLSGDAYLSVLRGTGPDATPAIVRVNREGKIKEVSLKDVKFAKAALPNASDKMAITGLAFVKGKVYVAGLTTDRFASNLRVIPFPFKDVDKGTSVEIWHAAHAAIETKSPIRTFVPYDIDGETNLLASYTCTPLVKFPVSQLKVGEKVRGTTIAELGNRNNPLDMIVYTKDGKDYLLIANSARGIMKVKLDGVDKAKGLTEPVRGGGVAGQPYEKVEAWKGIDHLAKLDKGHALALQRGEGRALSLVTLALP